MGVLFMRVCVRALLLIALSHKSVCTALCRCDNVVM